ncbi:ShlB/FhaC/HecB family hemolysin secretion/activation protein [Oscillatoria acuminata]|nr:ShlB/FhaC/HecB family hemolysin secretion/activation protein [Oscillatoria acuminata]
MKPLLFPVALAGSLTLCWFAIVPTRTSAQIVPDRTLPENSRVTPDDNTFIIEGGTSTTGGTLFHSFEEFSVPTNTEALFNNTDQINQILTRITGASISNIDGILRANGNANLFFLNPNGIVFGPNARLELGGSFLATTGDRFVFADGSFFSASNPETLPLLTVNAPIGLQFGTTSGPINVLGIGHNLVPDELGAVDRSNRSDGLQVNPGNTLAILGSSVTLDGGNLIAESGRIEVGSVSAGSEIKLNSQEQGLIFDYQNVRGFQDVQLTEKASIDASGPGGGDIRVHGRNINLNDFSVVLSLTEGNESGQTLQVNASDSIKLNELSAILAETYGTGIGSTLNINTGLLLIENGSTISAGVNDGEPGNVLSINVRELILENGGQISASSFFENGKAGDIHIRASDSITASGEGEDISEEMRASGIFANQNDPLGTRPGGNITLETRNLTVDSGAQIAVGTIGFGQAGTLRVTALDSIELAGRAQDPEFSSGLFASTLGFGNAGNLIIETSRLIVRDGAVISVKGQTLNDLEMVWGIEDIDNLPEEALDFFGIENPTELALGQAGNLTINSPLILLNEQGIIRATTVAGDNANIQITTNNLQLRRGSNITTDASRLATGGNITIDTQTLVLGENSNITARATDGRGGNIQVNTTADIRSFDSAIDASSQRGIDGVVAINRPEVDPAAALVELEEDRINPVALVPRGCDVGSSDNSSRFIVSGWGGLPPSPREPRSGGNFIDNLDPLPARNYEGSGENLGNFSLGEAVPVQRISEASNWQLNEQGEVVLIAAVEKSSPDLPGIGCDGEALSPGLKNVETAASGIPESITVDRFNVVGNSVFSEAEVSQVLSPYTNRSLSFADLREARSAITNLYVEAGYITTGAYLPPQTVRENTVEIAVVPGMLREIQVNSNRLHNYVHDRLMVAIGNEPVNVNRIVEALRLLRLDPLIQEVQGELRAVPIPGQNILEVNIIEASPFSGTQLVLDNRRSPGVSTFRQQVQGNYNNLLGLGDRLFFSYARTEGSNTWEGSYIVPITPRNTTLGFRYSNGNSQIVESPFDRLDIEANSRLYELTLRQPFQRATPEYTREFALGLTASRQASETSLLGDRFPLSAGANNNGELRVSALRFFQDWTQRQPEQVLALRSTFSLGVDAFDATVNNNAPDSRFFAWRGQGQWVRSFGRDTLLFVRGDVQLSPDNLVSFEQIGLGGLDTVRGYRQDTLLTDNGVLGSVELRLPVFRFAGGNGLVQIAPFLDVGTGWNSAGQANPNTTSLVSLGLGLQLELGNQLTARLDFGKPLVDINSRNRTWQENGIHFSVKYNPF